ncbi:MAG: hypothetical protein DCF25_17330 [Leptolyngbya foveolarum]|uniref:FAS1 domain-containing protein n=1 Tax=Leptolyngbya foveolarum TaxID=47253 RepID=A0A2W4TUT0_9CYAN|nr:MAG: hypothetical protein DCF25_17330 [Leptolyngbya foveolarum]
MTALPAGASVLVEPGIRRGGEVAPRSEEVSEPNSATQDIVGVASSNSEFSTLVTAIQAANLVEILSGEGPYTVFAPTNAAFSALPAGVLDTLLMPENRDLLVQLLYNHIAYGNVTSDQLLSGSLATFDGNVDITVMPDGVMVDGANVAIADVPATNGVIHAVDQVLLPTGFESALQARMNSGSSSNATSSSSGDSSSQTTTLQETTIDRSVAPTPVEAPTPTAAPEPTPQPAPEPAATEEPVRGLW